MQGLNLTFVLDIIGEVFSDEISIAITSKDAYIYYRPSKRIDLKISTGDPVKKGSLAYKAIQTGQKLSEFMNREGFGIPYQAMAVPFYDNGKLVGCVLAIYPSLTEGKSVVTVKVDDGWKPLPFEDVVFLKVENRKTYVYGDETFGTHKSTLQEFEYSLPRELFVRCHRSYIVNVHHIQKIYPDIHSTFVLEMKNGEHIPVSQSYSSYFRKLLDF